MKQGKRNLNIILRRARESKGLSRTELAARTGMTAKTIESIERPNSKPKIEQFQRITAALNIDLQQLLTDPRSLGLSDAREPAEPYTMPIRQAAEALGLPRTTLVNQIRAGKLGFTKIDGRVYVDADAVEHRRRLRLSGRS